MHKILERIAQYISILRSIEPTDLEVQAAIANLQMLITQLQVQHPNVTTEPEAIAIIDAECTEIKQSPSHRLATLRQFLNPERHAQAIKAIVTEVAKHYLEESVLAKAAITYLDTMSETPDHGAEESSWDHSRCPACSNIVSQEPESYMKRVS